MVLRNISRSRGRNASSTALDIPGEGKIKRERE